MTQPACAVCARPDDQKPMCFQGEPWCSDIHRKMVIGELPWAERDWRLQDEEERAAVAAMPAEERPHYELNDGTCVTCGEPWICTPHATASSW